MFRFASGIMLAICTAGSAAADQRTITFSHLANPSHEAALYAIKEGIVTSDTIRVEVTPLDISALQQAIAARTFDVVEGPPMSIPRANARGLPLQIIGTAQRSHPEGLGVNVWVRADSPYQTLDDLRGKRFGGYSLSSAGMTIIRIALARAHGLNVDARGGDLTFVELPEAALAAALAAGNVDGAVLIHAQAYQAMNSDEFRPIAQLGRDMTEKFDLQMVTSVLIGYGDKLEANPDDYREFLRMFRESVEYTRANSDEVFAAVAATEGIEPDFFTTWFGKFTTIPVYLSEGDLDAIDTLWTEATNLGVLEVPHTTAREAIWSGAVFSEDAQ